MSRVKEALMGWPEGYMVALMWASGVVTMVFSVNLWQMGVIGMPLMVLCVFLSVALPSSYIGLEVAT